MRRIALAGAGLLALAALSGPADATPEYYPVIPMLLNVRTSCNATYDRAVLDVSGPMPGHSQAWTNALTYDGSGKPVPLAGTAFVSVVLSVATAHVPDGSDAGLNVYSGPQLQPLGCTRLKGVAFTGDHEGYVSVGLATNKKTSFKVMTLTSPTRLVIDIAH